MSAARADPAFQTELDAYLKNYVGRPSALWFAERLTRHLGGAKVYFKRDELNHTGSHKANNCMGQILLAKRMGKTRIIAETGAGQHGVATATMCALFGLPCTVYMGATDVERQAPNVFRMKLLGAEVKPVTSGASTLKDAMNEALRDWVANVEDTYYLIGTVAGPHPYPMMVRDFQSVIGEEAKAQLREAEGRLPDAAVACIGGGSNAMGLFHPFLDDPSVRLIGVEAGGHGIETGEHAASLTGGRPGVLHGNRTYLLQDDDGQIIEAHSISAGPGLSGDRSGAFLAARHRPRGICFGDGRGGVGRVPALHADRGDHPRARAGACAGARDEARAYDGEGCDHPDESLWPWRQGHLHGRGAARGETVMGRIATRFAELKHQGRGALISFVEAWDPDAATSMELLRGMPEAGADLIEIGIPFTDPMADGPIVQAAGKRGLKAGVKVAYVLTMVREFRREDAATPIILMGYLNPILSYGTERFCADAAAAGVDGLIVVDLPTEEVRPAGAVGARARPRHHPPCGADHGRQAPAAGAEWQFGLRLLRQHHRHHRHAQRDVGAPRRGDTAHQARHGSADRCGVRCAQSAPGGGGRAHRGCRRGGIGLDRDASSQS